MEELLSLKWNNHSSTFVKVLRTIRDKQKYTDVTLACSGKFYSAHKIVLSTCSDYFEEIFDQADEKNLFIVLKDIRSEDLELLLDYMYLGEVSVRQTELSSLLKAAECLQIKGLAVADDAEDSINNQTNLEKPNSTVPSKKRKLQDISDNNSTDPSFIPRRQSKRKSCVPTESVEEHSPSAEDIEPMIIKEEVVAYEPETISVDEYKEEDLVETIPSIPPDMDADLDTVNPESLALKAGIDESNTFPASSYETDDPTEWLNDDSSLSYPANEYNQPETSGQTSVGNRMCPICFKDCICPSALEVHMRVHTGEKPYSCMYCAYKSKQKGHLTSHILRRHRAP